MEYDNTNKGIISKNDRKESDKHPDIKGSINVEGVEFWLDGWQKTRAKDGGKFYSLSVKRKEPKREEPRRQQQTSYDRDDARTGFARDLDDDLPF